MRFFHFFILACGLPLLSTAVFAGPISDPTATTVDSLLREHHAADAVKLLNRALKEHPDRADLYILLGRANLSAGDLDRAQDAFQTALERNEASAEAQTGIGEVHLRKASGMLRPIGHARAAVNAAHRATQMDPAYAPAYVLLGKSYERLNHNYGAALRAYRQALALHGSLETAFLLGSAYIELRRQPEQSRNVSDPLLDGAALQTLARYANVPEFMPIAAQIFMDRGEAQKALDTFKRYVDALPDTERAYYLDIAPVATRAEAKAYAQTSGEVRDEFLRQFWARRDENLLTEVNERLIEHYRRVWYARRHFSGGKTPWDRRGDIYIRYGDPDYRATSTQPGPPMSPAVEQVKERLALALYGSEAMDRIFTGPVYPVRSNQSFVGNLDPAALVRFDTGGNLLGSGVFLNTGDVGTSGDATAAAQSAMEAYQRQQMRPENQHTYLPVTTEGDMTIVPWETWIYTGVGEGIEITFTDELSNGVYDFAPIPDFPSQEGSVGLDQYTQYAYYAPRNVANQAVARVPDFYRPGGPAAGLEFSYDFADFRAADGKSRLEIYYAIDPSKMGVAASADTATIVADCAVVLTDSAFSQTYRTHDLFRFRALGYGRWPEGAFIPDQVALDIPPGNYLMTVQVNDRIARRQGIYRHNVHIEPYGRDSLQLSDVELCWDISDQRGDAKFRKGDVWVIPMTTRAYAENQNAYIYYEIYNLSRDDFGQVRYRLTYAIEAENPARPFNLMRSSVGALVGLFKGSEQPQVRVSLDQTGAAVSPTGYLELDLKKVKPGYNRLGVTVEDRIGGKIATKEIQFRYKK